MMAKVIARMAGAARRIINIAIIGVSSVDTLVLSIDGSIGSKFGDRAADRSVCDRNSRPQIATSAQALKEESA